MEKLEKIFLRTKMTWMRVIVLSLVCGVATGLLMVPKALQNTSFQQPGISFEFWILFALYIILNCEKPLEAGVKTFVAFLISQPVIYLVQVPFAALGWQLFGYYKYWFIITLFTFPGGMIAWYVKKGNILSVLILSGANLILCVSLPMFAQTLFRSFPRMLISTLFILAEMVFFILLLFKDRKKKLLVFIIAAVMLAGGITYTVIRDNTAVSTYTVDVEGEAPFRLSEETELFDLAFGDESLVIKYNPKKLKSEGEYTVRYSDASGTQREMKLIYGDGNVTAE